MHLYLSLIETLVQADCLHLVAMDEMKDLACDRREIYVETNCEFCLMPRNHLPSWNAITSQVYDNTFLPSKWFGLDVIPQKILSYRLRVVDCVLFTLQQVYVCHVLLQ